jgi:superoxide dismutase, Fe-Mn family
MLPDLVHGDTYGEHGIDGFISPEGFDLAWTQYQSMMLEKVNVYTYGMLRGAPKPNPPIMCPIHFSTCTYKLANSSPSLQGTSDATSRPQVLVEKYARSTDKAPLFNHASMAANNHFFFKCLSPTKTEPSTTFKADIDDSFSSYDTLRTEMIETADAMFGPGFVWIVKDHEQGKMKLLCTYLAGSPFPRAHVRAQHMDMSTFATGVHNRHSEPSNTSGSFGNHSKSYWDNARAPGNYSADPILGVNTWEHAYLRDYGIGGKRAYLERWWDRIDWAVVEEMARHCGPENATRRKRPSSTLIKRLNSSFNRSNLA